MNRFSLLKDSVPSMEKVHCIAYFMSTLDFKKYFYVVFRAALENSAAAIVYIAHTGNIVASFVLAFAML